ncbi:MAG: hypothetical protein ACXAE3_06720 [Candidatus Kariarchaeaceae archaeon]|jgi:hypothetical protein
MPHLAIRHHIYDIYVIKTSGIPLFAGCTGSEYCQSNMSGHELVSGYFSALHAFSEEAYQDQELQTMLFGEIAINFWIDREHELIFIFVHNRHAETPDIRKHLELGHSIFLERYGHHLDDDLVKLSLFEDFQQHLRVAGIIPHEMEDTGETIANHLNTGQEPLLRRWMRNFGQLLCLV